jgi:hypothetical protein
VRPRVGQNWHPPSGSEAIGLAPKWLDVCSRPAMSSSAISSAVGAGLYGESAQVTASRDRSSLCEWAGVWPIGWRVYEMSMVAFRSSMASAMARAIRGCRSGISRLKKRSPRAAPEVMYPGLPLNVPASGRLTRLWKNRSRRSSIANGSSFRRLARAQSSGPALAQSCKNHWYVFSADLVQSLPQRKDG